MESTLIGGDLKKRLTFGIESILLSAASRHHRNPAGDSQIKEELDGGESAADDFNNGGRLKRPQFYHDEEDSGSDLEGEFGDGDGGDHNSSTGQVSSCCTDGSSGGGGLAAEISSPVKLERSRSASPPSLLSDNNFPHFSPPNNSLAATLTGFPPSADGLSAANLPPAFMSPALLHYQLLARLHSSAAAAAIAATAASSNGGGGSPHI